MLDFPDGCRNDQVLAAQRSRRRRRALMDELATYAYRFPRARLPALDEDVPGDFYLFCRPKLEQMVDEFEERGAPFEHYVNSVLRWQLRTFLSVRKQLELGWQNALYSHTWDWDRDAHRQRSFDPAAVRVPAAGPHQPPAAPPPAAWPQAPALRLADPADPADPDDPDDPAGAPDAARNSGTTRPARRGRARRFRLPQDTGRRRVLFALLKTAHALDERQFTTLVAATGCHPDSLRRILSRLARLRAPARRRRQMLRERRNLAYAEFRFWSGAAFTEPDPPERALARVRAERHRHTKNLAQRELERVRLAPSNRQIAVVLGVPKGTVDTGLHWLMRSDPASYVGGDGVGSGQQQSL